MDDREKVLQALEHCDLCSDMPNCPGCAYLREPDCMEHLKRDILVLLKAQEPRIVTEADFENADEGGFIPTWCEEKDTGEVYCECIPIGALEDAKFGRVRWWTFRPTDEQREATLWHST